MDAKQENKVREFSLQIQQRIGLSAEKADALAGHFEQLSDIDEAGNQILQRLGMEVNDLLMIRQFFGA